MGKIYPAMLAAMAEIGAIGKSKRNPQQGYNFRGIDDVLNNLQPALIKAKVFVIPRLSEIAREERQTKAGGTIIYTTVKGEYDFVSAEDGSKVTACTYGEGMDTSDKSTNKAMSAALKYAVIQAFAIPTEELIDSEQDTHQPAPKPPKEDKPKHADEASEAQKKKLFAMSAEKFGSREKGLEFIKWCKGSSEYFTKSDLSKLFDDFDAQAALFADSQRAA